MRRAQTPRHNRARNARVRPRPRPAVAPSLAARRALSIPLCWPNPAPTANTPRWHTPQCKKNTHRLPRTAEPPKASVPPRVCTCHVDHSSARCAWRTAPEPSCVRIPRWAAPRAPPAYHISPTYGTGVTANGPCPPPFNNSLECAAGCRGRPLLPPYTRTPAHMHACCWRRMRFLCRLAAPAFASVHFRPSLFC